MSNKWQHARNRSFEGFETPSEFTPFFFVVLADTQLGLLKNNESWEEEMVRSRKAVQHINRVKPAFAIVCGDLIHMSPLIYPKVENNLEIQKAQIRDFKTIFEEVDKSIPLLCCCGNHDIGDRPNSASIDFYKKEFGDDYFSFYIKDIKCIVLNSSLYSDPTDAMDHFEEQHSWLKRELEDSSKSNRIFVFCHHPWFIQKGDEDEADVSTYTLIPDGSGMKIPDSYFHIPKERRMPVLELFDRYNVSVCFSGHWHKNGVAKYKNTEYVITGAVGVNLGDTDSGFRIVKVKEKEVCHEFYEFSDIPESISLL